MAFGCNGSFINLLVLRLESLILFERSHVSYLRSHAVSISGK